MGQIYTNRYDQLFITSALESFGTILPWLWFKAQAIAESSLKPHAISPCGAMGLMQLMPATAAEMAKKLGIADTPFDPTTNIRMGIAYDRTCWNIWKQESGRERLRFMLVSFNAGPGNIIKAQNLAAQKGLPTDTFTSIAATLPQITGQKNAAETIAYVAKIERLYEQLTQHPQKETTP